MIQIKNGHSLSQEGFTLTELMLAMVLFSAVLVISTVGFIGMNRTFNRGMIKKQLSEGVQRVSEDMGRTLRAQPVMRTPVACDGENEDCSAYAEGWHTLSFATVCYMWKTSEFPAGLHKISGECDPDGDKEEILSARYRVKELAVDSTAVSAGSSQGLYSVSGVFTTLVDEAIHAPDPDAGDTQWRCLGTAQHPDVASCAVEQFRIIINPQGVSS